MDRIIYYPLPDLKDDLAGHLTRSQKRMRIDSFCKRSDGTHDGTNAALLNLRPDARSQDVGNTTLFGDFAMTQIYPGYGDAAQGNVENIEIEVPAAVSRHVTEPASRHHASEIALEIWPARLVEHDVSSLAGSKIHYRLDKILVSRVHSQCSPVGQADITSRGGAPGCNDGRAPSARHLDGHGTYSACTPMDEQRFARQQPGLFEHRDHKL
jgi:hypothetical protein